MNTFFYRLIDDTILLCTTHAVSIIGTVAVWLSSMEPGAKVLVALLDAAFILATLYYWLGPKRKTHKLEQRKLELEIEKLEKGDD